MNHSTIVKNEYDFLDQVIVCSPEHMKIEEIINETQKKYLAENINIKKAMRQHLEFVKVLKEHKVNVLNLQTSKNLPEQVFARDIAFTIGPTVYIANMKEKIRKRETEILKNFFKSNNIPYESIVAGHIEGGDVIVDNQRVFIGISGRTSNEGVNELQKKLHDYEIIRIPISSKYLHLDCVFNILSNSNALIYKEAFPKEILDFLHRNYNLIEIPKVEQKTLGTNILQIDNHKILSLNINVKTNQLLRENGYTVFEVDITEIIKSGGAFRCITLPIMRRNN
jgi:N-dimethylarginine dimethylaminohydrolase